MTKIQVQEEKKRSKGSIGLMNDEEEEEAHYESRKPVDDKVATVCEGRLRRRGSSPGRASSGHVTRVTSKDAESYRKVLSTSRGQSAYSSSCTRTGTMYGEADQ